MKMANPSRITLALFGLAVACYLAEWTTLGAGLGILGMLFEAVMWLSLLADIEAPNQKAQDRYAQPDEPTALKREPHQSGG
jgi:hypothetical protein